LLRWTLGKIARRDARSTTGHRLGGRQVLERLHEQDLTISKRIMRR
jgi:hypothetical protein